MDSYIAVEHLSKVYKNKNYEVKAVNDVSFQIRKGEFVGIMGSSGSGKSTLLNVLATIDQITDGKIFFEGLEISKFGEDELEAFRQQNLGFVFQEYNLLDTLKIEENILLPYLLLGGTKEEALERVENIAATLQIKDILSKYPYEISGGQKQRAACARALIHTPKLILADEPTGALDSKASKVLMNTLETMNHNLQATILMVTHDAFSACYCQRILFLQDGVIFHEINRGKKSTKEYLLEILDVLSEAEGDDLYAKSTCLF